MMNNIYKKFEQASIALFAMASSMAWAVNDLPGGPAVRQLNLHPPVTKIAEEQVWLHWFMLIICTVIFVAVFGVMFYSIWKHRKSAGHKAASFHESLKVEIAWTVVPFVIVILMALPATKAVVASKDTSNADLTIKATGYQWKWGYDYIKGEGEGIGFISTLDNAQREMSNSGNPEPTDNYLLKVDNPLVVPVNQKVRIITTSNDVIHSFQSIPLVSSKMPFQVLCVTLGSVPKKPVTSTANAKSCAVKNMLTCPSTSKWSALKSTPLGWLIKIKNWLQNKTTPTKFGPWLTSCKKAKRSMRPTAKHVTKRVAKAWDPSKRSMAQQSCWMLTQASRSKSCSMVKTT